MSRSRPLSFNNTGTSASKGAGGGGAQPTPNRELEGRLYAGHDSFEWLLAVVHAVMAAEVTQRAIGRRARRQRCLQALPQGCRACACHSGPTACRIRCVPTQRHLKRGDYLWELIASGAKEKDSVTSRRCSKHADPVRGGACLPCAPCCRRDQDLFRVMQPWFALTAPPPPPCALSPSGRYRVKLWILDGWRSVTVDDRIPVDLFGALHTGPHTGLLHVQARAQIAESANRACCTVSLCG